MNKKLISILSASLLAGSLMVGCSSSDTSNEKDFNLKNKGLGLSFKTLIK